MNQDNQRFIATVTFYVHDKNEKKAFIQARKIAKKIDTKFGGDCELESLHRQPFATMELEEIDINQLRLEL
jgi:hypothetical protein